MYVLKKIFQLRDKTHDDEEKPFLEHLEDLRIVITRVVLTLVIAMGVCFAFRNELMDIIRRPVMQVWEVSQKSKMPEGPVKVDLKTWEAAKKAVRNTIGYTPEQREHYYSIADKDGSLNLSFHAEAVRYYRAAIDIENTYKAGDQFIDDLPGVDEQMRQQLRALMDEEKRPDAAVDSRGKLVLMQALNPTEGFMLSIKLSLFAGIVISFPLLLFFILQFILPGLKKNEKKALWPALAIGFGLFLGGVLFSYFFVLPKVLDFFYTYSQDMGVSNEWRIGYYISFATQFTLIFGLAFELPVVVMTMVRLGILNYEIMRNTRSYAILAIVVIAAVITPTPDVATLAFLAVPMILLYEICIWLAFFYKRKEREEELREQEELNKKLLAAPVGTASYGNDDHDDDGYPDGDHYHDPYYDGDHDDIDEHYDYHDDPHDHTECEGDEADTGTYDFDDHELDEDYDDHSLADHHDSSGDEGHHEKDTEPDAGDEEKNDSPPKKNDPDTEERS